MSETGAFGFSDAVDVLDGALEFGVNPSLESMRALCEELGRPQDAFAAIQVAGTNGKSSVTRLISAVLQGHGLKTGMYLSPHLHSYVERIACSGEVVTEASFAKAVGEVLAAARRAGIAPTEFEILTAAALCAFRDCGVEVAVLEVGMGGRWDATSVVDPAVAVITGIALDHTEHLGDTREEIAADKAHIIKSGSIGILGPATIGVERIFEQRAGEEDASTLLAVRMGMQLSPFDESQTVRFTITSNPTAPDGTTHVDVAGFGLMSTGIEVRGPAYQAANVATALAAAQAFTGQSLDAQSVRSAVAATIFPGRFQVIERDPWVVVDGAHNPNGAEALSKAILAAWPDDETRPTIVLGVLADKDADNIVQALAGAAARFVCVAPDTPRARDATQLAAIVESVTGVQPEVAKSVAAAVQEARSRGVDTVVTGSIRMVADALASTT
ncbi:MAG: Mur ligase family protein [Coriobacteriia bacterium]|nr:Mur ligase family protein [Coriobacteriia bacterium]